MVDNSYQGDPRSFLRALERSEEISTASGVNKHDRTYHNNAPKEHQHGKPDAWAHSLEEYVAWNLPKRFENPMNFYEKWTCLEDRVGKVKNCEAQQIFLIAETQVGCHVVELGGIQVKVGLQKWISRPTLAFPMLVRSKKLKRYRNDNQGMSRQSIFLMSFASSIPEMST